MPCKHLSALLLTAILAAPAAPAADLANDTYPDKWLNRYLPEQLADLKPPSYFTDLDKARQQAYRGRYKQALLTIKFAKLTGPEPACISAYALAAMGRTDEALKALHEPNVAGDPAVRLMAARVHARNADYAPAIDILQALVKQQPDALAPRVYLGLYLEQNGQVAAAREQFDHLHEQYWEKWKGMGDRLFEDADSFTLLGQAFDHWARLNGKYANDPALHKEILKLFVQAYDIIDRSWWPAHVAAAEYYMSHENDKDAGKELVAALNLNPNDTHAQALAGYLALKQYKFDGADQAVAAIREIDPDSLEGALLQTREQLALRRPKDAETTIRKVLAKHPDNVEALGLLASTSALQLRHDEVSQLLARIEKLQPHNASAYYELGEQLGAMRQYPAAEKMYEKAIERAPWMSEARNGLGLLLTQSGDEPKARTVLEAAYAYDPFNFRTTNYLRLLDRMEKMDRVESPHFVLLYDHTRDPIIQQYVLDYMESIYPAVCGDFQHQPTVKTDIEIFPTHEQFSARITGAPWLPTVGASTGSVIALATPAPGEGNAMGTYNWAQVLRHEFTHTVTLSATENRISHWMTEGLAVNEEQVPMRWEWVPMLYEAVRDHQLFDMEELTWAFVRPKRPTDRSMAYAQSAWICQYIEQKWGHPALLRMMADYKAGRSQDDIFPDVLGVPVKSFEQQFADWAEKQVATWGLDKQTSEKYDELCKEGNSLLKARQYPEALKVWQEAAGLRPMDQLPCQRLAFLYLNAHDFQNARAMLIRLDDGTTKDNRFAKRISRLCLDNKDLPGAEKYALKAIYIDPYDQAAHELLLEVAQKSNDGKAAAREQQVIPVLSKFRAELRRSTLLPGAPQP